jgi:hypothetical protein
MALEVKMTPETQRLLKEKKGFRCPGEFDRLQPIADILDHEITELGNDHLILEIKANLGVKDTKALRQQFPEAKGLWLTSRKAASELYCSGDKPEAYKIPECAKLVSDLGYDGALFLLPQGCEAKIIG